MVRKGFKTHNGRLSLTDFSKIVLTLPKVESLDTMAEWRTILLSLGELFLILPRVESQAQWPLSHITD